MAESPTSPREAAFAGQVSGWEDPAHRLRRALNRDELALFCQPIAALSGPVRFPMAEVLVRLREEERAMLPPGEFLPVFEHYRLMPDLDRWVVKHVIEHLAAGSRIPHFTINISTQTLEDAGFAKAMAIELVSAGVPGTSLSFELGEKDTLMRLDAVLRFAHAVRAVGCAIMVGGFGRRSASFQALKALQPSYVKVDGTITRRILSHPPAEAKLRAILRVGEVMGFKAIAEMVEEQDILARLKALGVAYAQGFGIRQPHPIEAIASTPAAR